MSRVAHNECNQTAQLQTLRQEMVSPQPLEAEDLPHLQDRLLGHAEEGKAEPMTNAVKCLIAAALVVAFTCGCELAKNKTVIVYDQWWSSDFAAGGAERSCSWGPDRAVHEVCATEAREAEAEFVGKFFAAFQSDPACAGLQLVVADGSKKEKFLDVLARTREQWYLMVDFSPRLKEQSWTVVHQPHADKVSKGEGNASSMAHSVCSIAGNRGGSVLD
jgi:hypothetical protein